MNMGDLDRNLENKKHLIKSIEDLGNELVESASKITGFALGIFTTDGIYKYVTLGDHAEVLALSHHIDRSIKNKIDHHDDLYGEDI